MGSFKFELVVYGGIADDEEAKVAADKVGDVLKGMTLDVEEICRNLADGEDVASEECRIYVVGMPTKGKSIAFPMAAGAGRSAAEWGAIGIQTFASGARELRESIDFASPKVPRGFGPSILRRIRDYCQAISEDHEGFSIDLPAVNGTPALRATFDHRLKTAVELKLAAIEHARALEPQEAPDLKLYGYSLQGILFEMSDPNYESLEGTITVEIDARDGRQWVCHLDKSLAPRNLQDLWRTEVLVTGDATVRPRKPVLEAKTFTPLPGVADPVRAAEELIALCGTSSRESIQSFMDRVRERD